MIRAAHKRYASPPAGRLFYMARDKLGGRKSFFWSCNARFWRTLAEEPIGNAAVPGEDGVFRSYLPFVMNDRATFTVVE